MTPRSTSEHQCDVIFSGELAPPVAFGAPTAGHLVGIKDAVRALLVRLPDDCTLDDIIDHICDLGREAREDTPLTEAQREEIDRRLATLDQEPEPTVSWHQFLRSLDRSHRE
jgi:putative addiction module component (TIGR02574 family)